MKVKVLGDGCTKCNLLEKVIHEAANELNINVEVENVKELAAMNYYGVFEIPGLVINEELKSKGRIPTVEEVKEYLQ